MVTKGIVCKFLTNKNIEFFSYSAKLKKLGKTDQIYDCSLSVPTMDTSTGVEVEL